MAIARALLALAGFVANPSDLPQVSGISAQPVVAQVRRLLAALESVGQPLLTAEERAELEAAMGGSDDATVVARVQELLDRYCVVGVQINPESRVKVWRGPYSPPLVEQGWSACLVKVRNEAGVTAPLRFESPHAAPLFRVVEGEDPPVAITDADLRDRWLDGSMHDQPPMNPTLSGLELEYRILELYSRDSGRLEATLRFHVGAGTSDLGARGELAVLFFASPSRLLRLQVLEADGSPSIASFVFRDERERVYPLPSKRLAPDFFFHEQIYRADGESIRLPEGTYRVRFTRGPEYRVEERTITVGKFGELRARFVLERWIHPAAMGWWSGDHHVHAAGCSHYTDPTRGVGPEDMMRHILGEDLNVGCVLSWGPCWYHQKSFFEGKVSELSRPGHLMRYDVEVSGFPSSHAGHLCLLGLAEDDYPGTSRIEEWPSFNLPVLKWGQSQGAVVGYSHSGFGLETSDRLLPSLEVPRYDSIGANEYVVDVTHDAVDFISSVDTPWPFELSIWYHTNNAGFRARLSGETDFPCIYDQRIGMGRVYARLDGPLEYAPWLAAVKAGRSYVSEGRAHLLDFRVDERAVGTEGSELSLAAPRAVKVRVTAAALLDEEPDPETRSRPIDHAPYWDLERARIDDSRQVAVEVVVNGAVAARRAIEADGALNELEFDVPIERSSWIACRIHASAHTNPVYVLVGGAPIRASRRSIQWCLDGVEQCRRSKAPLIKPQEREAFHRAFDHARDVYRARLAECAAD